MYEARDRCQFRWARNPDEVDPNLAVHEEWDARPWCGARGSAAVVLRFLGPGEVNCGRCIQRNRRRGG